jgi:hypothetical protein
LEIANTRCIALKVRTILCVNSYHLVWLEDDRETVPIEWRRDEVVSKRELNNNLPTVHRGLESGNTFTSNLALHCAKK